MSIDDRLRDSLRRIAHDVVADVEAERAAVGRRLTRDRRVRWGIVSAVAVGVAVTVALIAGLAHWFDLSQATRPVSPPTFVVPQPPANPFSVERVFTQESLGLSRPVGLAIAPTGDFYVTDRNQTVSQFSERGELIHRWGTPGSGPGQFRMVSGGVAVGPNGWVYVVDTGNFRVQVFTSSGRFLTSLGSFGSGPGQFLYPSDVAVDGRGDVFVTDDRAATVTMLHPDGTQAWRVGDPGSVGDLIGHEHIAQVDAQGRLLMANDDAGLVLWLDADGRIVEQFGSGASAGHAEGTFPVGGDFPDGACNATEDGAGYVYVNSCQEQSAPHHETEVYGPDHRLVGSWADSPFALSPRFGLHGQVLALSHDGSVLELSVKIAPPS